VTSRSRTDKKRRLCFGKLSNTNARRKKIYLVGSITSCKPGLGPADQRLVATEIVDPFAVQLKLYAASFVLLFASLNGWVVYHALQDRHSTVPSGQLYLFHPILPSVRPPADAFSSTGIQKFRSWLDSLQSDSAGRKIYDSIRHERPGLFDSLGQTEKSDFIHH
jgi:hypothetical protein